MRMLLAQVRPLSVEYDDPTRYPAASGPFVSFHPTKTVPDPFTTIVGSTCHAYGDEPSVILMFGSNGPIASGVEAVARIGAGRAATLDVPEVGGTKTIDATTIAISRTTNGRNALPRMVGEGERDNNHLLGIGAVGSTAVATQPRRLNTMPRLRTTLGLTGGLGVPL